jgi:hypothetical protein
MMTLESAIRHCEEVAEEQEKLCKVNDDFNISQPTWKECAEEHRQLAGWLKCLAKISDMLDGTIDHLNGDDAKELLSDVKWELKLAKLTEL